MNVPLVVPRPTAWKYVLTAVVLLIVVIPLLWHLMTTFNTSPEFQELTLRKLLFWLVAAPTFVVVTGVAALYVRALGSHYQSENRALQTMAEQSEQDKARAQREYVLEVIGLGVTLDKYRQGKLWEQIKNGNAFTSIREQDPNKYPWTANEKEGLEGTRQSDTLTNAAKYTPAYWGVPSFGADGPDFTNEASLMNPVLGLAASAQSSGMAFHLFTAAGWELSDRPDRLMERVFAFFDEHADVPYVVVSGADGLLFRNMYRPEGSEPLIYDGQYVPSMPDSSAMFVLARRERVEAVRPFAFDDKYDAGLARQLFEYYVALQDNFPRIKDGPLQRPPTVAEWLVAAQAFTKLTDIYPGGVSSFIDPLNPFTPNHPDRHYKPTPFFPLPWNKDQLAEFDALPTLGFLHRPVFVKMTNDQGEPLKRSDERAAAMAAGWEQALQTLPESERQSAITRLVTATGNDSKQALALYSAINEWTKAGGNEIERDQSTQWINTDARLGNTGAATWFVQMALGVMGSYRDGGVSAAINMRDPKEASIILISPPSEAKRAEQNEIRGDVFRHYSTPAIDPANYEPR